MKSFKTMTNALLVAAGLSSGVGLTAHAQTVTLNGTTAAATAAQVGGGGLQYACAPYASASPANLQTFVFTPGTNNEVIDKWTLQGNGVATTGTTGTTFSFSPTGFGKARVTVGYYYNNGTIPVFCPGGTVPITCPGTGQQLTTPVRLYTTRTYEFFKLFTPAQGGYGISGPTCLPATNSSVVYSINPPVVSTAAQAAANIGTDDYTWVVKNAAGTTLSPPAYAVADGGTSITIFQPAFLNQSNFTVEVKAGKCNSGLLTAGFTLPVVVAPDLNAAITSFPPACLPVGATTSSFTFNTVLNTTYSLGTTVGLMSTPLITTPAANISIAGTGSPVTVTLSSIPTAGSGAITIVGVGAAGVCFGTQTVIRQVNRQLVLAQNGITPTCVSANATGVVLTMANAPAGATWTVPAGSGWTITNQTGNTATVNTGAASAAVTVTTACGSISPTISVAGTVTGCDYGVFNISNQFQPHQYGVGAVSGNTCATTGNFYTWSLLDPATSLVTQTSPRIADTGLPASRTYSFAPTPAVWPNYTVRVRVENSTTGICLDILRTAPNQTQRAAAGGAATGGTAPKAGAKAALDQVLVYPNPSSDILTIELPEAAKGVARVEIVDVLGRVQRELTTTSQWTLVPVAKLPAGTYTVRVALPDGTRTARPVVVSH